MSRRIQVLHRSPALVPHHKEKKSSPGHCDRGNLTTGEKMKIVSNTFVVTVCLFTSIALAFAADHLGGQLPLSIPQKTFDYVAKKGKLDSRGSLTHWVSCGHTLDERTAERDAARENLAACKAENSFCQTPDFPDGSGGALWKPEAEGGGFPGNPTFLGSNAIKAVEILDEDEKKILDLRLRYLGGPGNRSVWDSPIPAGNYPSVIIVRAHYENDSCEDRTVVDPTKRKD